MMRTRIQSLLNGEVLCTAGGCYGGNAILQYLSSRRIHWAANIIAAVLIAQLTFMLRLLWSTLQRRVARFQSRPHPVQSGE